MTLQGGRGVTGRREEGPEHTPRLRLKPKAPPTGHADVAWGRAVMTFRTFPDLLAVQSCALRHHRVVYNPPSGRRHRQVCNSEHAGPTRESHLQPTSTLEVLEQMAAIQLVAAPSVRPRHRAPGDDGRRGTEQRIDGRQPTGGQRPRAKSPDPGGCHRTGLDHTRLSVQMC